jgi:hypothetical protein
MGVQARDDVDPSRSSSRPASVFVDRGWFRAASDGEFGLEPLLDPAGSAAGAQDGRSGPSAGFREAISRRAAPPLRRVGGARRRTGDRWQRSRQSGRRLRRQKNVAPRHSRAAAARTRDWHCWSDRRCRRHLRVGRCGRCGSTRQHRDRRRSQETPTQRQPLVAMTLPEQAVVANLHESLRQHVLREATQELLRRQRHCLDATRRRRIGVVAVAERHLAVLEPQQPMVADRHPVRVAGQVLEHALGTAERRLGVDHPFLVPQTRLPGRELLGSANEVRRLGNTSVPVANSRRSPARNLPRKTRLRTRTGRKKPGRHDTQRGDASTWPCASHDRPPPVTTQYRCG